jgi:pimeloyl-ACP methyl ester carboxylesterase
MMHDPIGADSFRVDVPDAVLADLKDRLGRTRWPLEAKAPPWTFGASLRYMQQICAYWRDQYDWRKSEAQLNRWPQYKVGLGGKQVHFILEKGSGPDPLPLIITHGWPGSVVEFLSVIDPLAHPERYGGDVRDAFTVIAPSLPGYGFSDAPDVPMHPRAVAALWYELMTRVLGCRRYVAQGGDWGGIVTSWLALDRPEGMVAMHSNIVALHPEITDAHPLDAEELDWQRRNQARRATETAYHQINATKPQTLAYGLQDSPSGCAAWILEKFHGWSVPGEDVTDLPFDKDQLLANVMLYWLNGSNAPAWLYHSVLDPNSRVVPNGKKVEVPTAMLLFPRDIAVPAPSQYIQRVYNLVRRTDAPGGGHFGAFEKPDLFVEDVRSFFRDYR